jgi:hypothetical protein
MADNLDSVTSKPHRKVSGYILGLDKYFCNSSMALAPLYFECLKNLMKNSLSVMLRKVSSDYVYNISTDFKTSG